MSTLREATLLRARTLSPSVRELTFDAGRDFRFVAGQWVNLRGPADAAGEPLVRAYSIASAPSDDGVYSLAITRVTGGPMSNWLHELAVGARVVQSHAQGFFTLDPVVRPIVMIGTGTGVTPLRSMLLSLVDDPPDVPLTLLFGNRTEEDILYRDDFSALSARLPTFTFVPTLSRGATGWTGRSGYVQAHLPEIVDRVGKDADFYVCGLNKMVADVRSLLRKQLGVDRQRVHGERYD